MAVESDNKQGNRWHSSEDGKFISGPNGDSIGVDDLTLANFGLGEELNLDELGQMIDLASEELSLDDFGEGIEELNLDDFEEEFEDEEIENVDDVLNMSEESYDLFYNQGRTIPAFDNFNDVLQNIDYFMPDQLIDQYIKTASFDMYTDSRIMIKNTNLSMGFAFDFFTRARSASTHFKGISDDEFMEKLSTMPQTIPAIKNWADTNNDYISTDDIQDMFDVFLKGGKTAYIPIFHGIRGIQAHRDMKTIMCQYKDNVKGAADTVLIGDGCLDYACYCALGKGYSYGSYSGNHDGALIRLIAQIDSNTRICLDNYNCSEYNINNAPKTWRKKSDILKEYKQYLPQLKSAIQQKLINSGVNTKIINSFLKSLDPNDDRNNNSVALALLGYDFVYGDNQLDVINPSRVLMNTEKYKSDDD